MKKYFFKFLIRKESFGNSIIIIDYRINKVVVHKMISKEYNITERKARQNNAI